MLSIERLAQPHDQTSYTAMLRDVLNALISRLQRGHHVLDVVPMRHVFIPGDIGHLHPHPELIINCIGHGRLQLLDDEFSVRPETLVLTPRGVAHLESPVDERELYANIILSCSRYRFGSHIRISEPHNHQKHGHIRQRFVFEDVRLHRCRRYFDEACVANGEYTGQPNALCRGLTMAACALLVEILEDKSTAMVTTMDDNAHIIQLARSYAEQHISDCDLRVSKIAQKIGCSADYLSHRYHQIQGQHLNHWITEQRMELATHLLRDSGMGVEEVARAAGYRDPSYFSRCFKSQFGLSPRVWRKSLA